MKLFDKIVLFLEIVIIVILLFFCSETKVDPVVDTVDITETQLDLQDPAIVPASITWYRLDNRDRDTIRVGYSVQEYFLDTVDYAPAHQLTIVERSTEWLFTVEDLSTDTIYHSTFVLDFDDGWYDGIEFVFIDTVEISRRFLLGNLIKEN